MANIDVCAHGLRGTTHADTYVLNRLSRTAAAHSSTVQAVTSEVQPQPGSKATSIASCPTPPHRAWILICILAAQFGQ